MYLNGWGLADEKIYFLKISNTRKIRISEKLMGIYTQGIEGEGENFFSPTNAAITKHPQKSVKEYAFFSLLNPTFTLQWGAFLFQEG